MRKHRACVDSASTFDGRVAGSPHIHAGTAPGRGPRQMAAIRERDVKVSVVPAPGAVSALREPPSAAVRSRMLRNPCPWLSASASKPRPLSLMRSTRPCASTLNSRSAVEHPGMAHQVVDGFLEQQEHLAADVRADGDVLLDRRRPEPEVDVPRGADVADEVPHPLARDCSGDPLVGLIAQTMSLIESTSSRESPAIDESGWRAPELAHPVCGERLR